MHSLVLVYEKQQSKKLQFGHYWPNKYSVVTVSGSLGALFTFLALTNKQNAPPLLSILLLERIDPNARTWQWVQKVLETWISALTGNMNLHSSGQNNSYGGGWCCTVVREISPSSHRFLGYCGWNRRTRNWDFISSDLRCKKSSLFHWSLGVACSFLWIPRLYPILEKENSAPGFFLLSTNSHYSITEYWLLSKMPFLVIFLSWWFVVNTDRSWLDLCRTSRVLLNVI